MSQSKGNASYRKEINLERGEKGDDDPEEEDTYQDDTKGKYKVSRKAADSLISTDLHPSNSKESFDHDNIFGYLNSRRSNKGLEEREKADEEATKQKYDKNEEASNLVRLSRNINKDLDKYTDQDERSSLYDDYEAKDVEKRGVLNGPEDYEEIEDDLSGISEDMIAVQESSNEAEKKETRKDARVKRDQAVAEIDKVKSSPDDPAKLDEPKTAANIPYSCEVSRIELPKSSNEASAPNDASKIKGVGSKEMSSKLSDSSKIQESTNVASSKRDESDAEYEKRVEEEIQRKINSIKEEIQQDIEAQQRLRDIEENNARFDELRDQEHEDEERQNFENEPIEKRQTVAKRSIREIADDAAVSSKRNKKRFLRREQPKMRQHRFSQIGKSDTSKENKSLKKRFVTNHDKSSEEIPSKEPFKKKRERTRQIFLANNDQYQTKKRQSRSTLLFDRTVVRPENELFMNSDLNSYLHADNRMVRISAKQTKIINNNNK